MGRKGGRRGTIDGYILGGMTVKGKTENFVKQGKNLLKFPKEEIGVEKKKGLNGDGLPFHSELKNLKKKP